MKIFAALTAFSLLSGPSPAPSPKPQITASLSQSFLKAHPAQPLPALDYILFSA